MFTADNESGFTLVELMVAVAIVSIMGMIAIPSFRSILPRIRLSSDTMVLSNEIAVARMRAISKSSDFRITLDPGNDSYQIEKNVMTTLGPPAIWEWRNLGTNFLKGTDLKSVTGFKTANTMVASPMGAINVPLNSKAYIILQEPPVPPATEGTNQKRITVEQMGRIKVERRRAGGPWRED